MAKIYKKPVVSIDTGLSEGVYTASGASAGSLSVTYVGPWDSWGTSGGKALAQASWSGLSGTIILNVTFNDAIDGAETEPSDSSVSCSWSGQTATFTFNADTTTNPLILGVHLEHGTSIHNLKMTGYTYSAN